MVNLINSKDLSFSSLAVTILLQVLANFGAAHPVLQTFRDEEEEEDTFKSWLCPARESNTRPYIHKKLRQSYSFVCLPAVGIHQKVPSAL